MAFSRNDLKKSFEIKQKFIRALDDYVYIKPCSAFERMSIMNDMSAAEQAKQSKQTEMFQNMAARLIQLCLVDEQGNRHYEESEINQVLKEMRGDVMDQIGNAAMVAIGLSSDDIEDEEQPEKKA